MGYVRDKIRAHTARKNGRHDAGLLWPRSLTTKDGIKLEWEQYGDSGGWQGGEYVHTKAPSHDRVDYDFYPPSYVITPHGRTRRWDLKWREFEVPPPDEDYYGNIYGSESYEKDFFPNGASWEQIFRKIRSTNMPRLEERYKSDLDIARLGRMH